MVIDLGGMVIFIIVGGLSFVLGVVIVVVFFICKFIDIGELWYLMVRDNCLFDVSEWWSGDDWNKECESLVMGVLLIFYKM